MWDCCSCLLCCRENGVGYLDLTQPQDASPLHANLIKSDGSTLYLTRHVVIMLMRVDELQLHRLTFQTCVCVSLLLQMRLWLCVCLRACVLRSDAVLQRRRCCYRPTTKFSSDQTLLCGEWITLGTRNHESLGQQFMPCHV